MAPLYGRAGRLTAKNGGCRPGHAVILKRGSVFFDPGVTTAAELVGVVNGLGFAAEATEAASSATTVNLQIEGTRCMPWIYAS